MGTGVPLRPVEVWVPVWLPSHLPRGQFSRGFQGWRISRNCSILLWLWSPVADWSLGRTQATSGGLCAMNTVIFQLQTQSLARSVASFLFVLLAPSVSIVPSAPTSHSSLSGTSGLLSSPDCPYCSLDQGPMPALCCREHFPDCMAVAHCP